MKKQVSGPRKNISYNESKGQALGKNPLTKFGSHFQILYYNRGRRKVGMWRINRNIVQWYWIYIYRGIHLFTINKRCKLKKAVFVRKLHYYYINPFIQFQSARRIKSIIWVRPNCARKHEPSAIAK